MRDAVARQPGQLDRIAAADDRVAGVEGDLDERRIGCLEQLGDLLGTLDVGRGVRVECRRDAAVGCTPRGSLDSIGSPAEVVSPQPRRVGRIRPARGLETDRVLVAGEHDRPTGAGGGQDLDRPVEEREIVAEPSSSAMRRGENAPASSRPYGASAAATLCGPSPKYPGGPSSIPV